MNQCLDLYENILKDQYSLIHFDKQFVKIFIIKTIVTKIN